MRLLLTARQSGDPVQAPKLLENLLPELVITDGAYSSARSASKFKPLVQWHASVPIRHMNRNRPSMRSAFRHRYVIERFFRKLRNFRRVATRYDKLPENFLGFVWLAAILIHLQ